MFNRFLKAFFGILLLPVVIAACVSFYTNLQLIAAQSFSSVQLIFLCGIFFYCGFHLFLFKPNYLYVFGHELMHAMAAWLCLGKVKSFKVSREGGRVKTSKSNFFITLAPYFVPAYAVIFSIIYFVLSLFFDADILSPYFVFAVGLSLAFHLVMTADVLKKKQSDIFKTGYVFSFVLIALFNVMVVAMLFSWLFESVAMSDFFKETFIGARELYTRIFTQIF